MDGLKTPATDTEFVTETVKRSMPNPYKPRLRTESENKVAEVERRTAQGYAGLETAQHRLNVIAAQMEAEANTAGIPEHDLGSEDSTVHHVEVIRSTLKTG